MAGYLETYRAGEEKREKIVWRIIAGIVVAIVLAVTAWFMLRNRAEEKVVNTFLDDLRNRNYPSAYALWGCTTQNPCRDYNYDRFMEDWGPKSPHADLSGMKLAKTKSCSGGIISMLEFPNGNNVNLWVNRRDHILGFAPWPVCNPRMPVP